jgi:hypothetical protein
MKKRTRVGHRLIGYVLAGAFFTAVTACSSDQPKPMAQPTPDQVRGHADGAFEKLKEEEKGRAVNQPAPY